MTWSVSRLSDSFWSLDDTELIMLEVPELYLFWSRLRTSSSEFMEIVFTRVLSIFELNEVVVVVVTLFVLMLRNFLAVLVLSELNANFLGPVSCSGLMKLDLSLEKLDADMLAVVGETVLFETSGVVCGLIVDADVVDCCLLNERRLELDIPDRT